MDLQSIHGQRSFDGGKDHVLAKTRKSFHIKVGRKRSSLRPSDDAAAHPKGGIEVIEGPLCQIDGACNVRICCRSPEVDLAAAPDIIERRRMKVHLLPEINCKVKTNRRSATAKTRHGGQSDIEVLQIESARYKWDPIFLCNGNVPIDLASNLPRINEDIADSRRKGIRRFPAMKFIAS